jgi:hypothetical protein
MVPVYGPNWESRAPKRADIIWRMTAARYWKQIIVPPWCKTPRPKRIKREKFYNRTATY